MLQVILNKPIAIAILNRLVVKPGEIVTLCKSESRSCWTAITILLGANTKKLSYCLIRMILIKNFLYQ